MLKIVTVSERTGHRTVYLGLDADNTRELHKGRPIKVLGSQLGVECDIVLLAGDTLNDVAEDLRSIGINIPPSTPGLVGL